MTTLFPHTLREGERIPSGLRTAWAHAVEAARFAPDELNARLQRTFAMTFHEATTLARHVTEGGEKNWSIVPTAVPANTLLFGELGRIDNLNPGGTGEFVAFTRRPSGEVSVVCGERRHLRDDRGDVQRIVDRLAADGHGRLRWAVVPIYFRPKYPSSKL